MREGAPGRDFLQTKFCSGPICLSRKISGLEVFEAGKGWLLKEEAEIVIAIFGEDLEQILFMAFQSVTSLWSFYAA